jgi:hypothetical protein
MLQTTGFCLDLYKIYDVKTVLLTVVTNMGGNSFDVEDITK